MASLIQLLKKEKEEQVQEGIYEWLQIAFAFHSCRLEGNMTNYRRTRRLFRNRDEKEAEDSYDHTEIIEHFQLFDAMLESIHKPLTVDMIKGFHRILRDDTEDYLVRNGVPSGEFRTKEPESFGCRPEDILPEMNALISDFKEDGKNRRIDMTDIARFHLRFEDIHPFPDDNGPIGRMLIAKQCLDNDMVPAIPGQDTGKTYFAAFGAEDPLKAMQEYLKKEQWLYARMLNWWNAE